VNEPVPRRTLLIGANGQLGTELQRELGSCCTLTVTTRAELDLADTARIRRVIQDTNPELIVNAAAYTAVDRAESEPELAARINGVAPGVIAEEAARLGAALIHFSTDFVFDGRKGFPYVETDPTGPLNVYGRTKLDGERAILETEARAYIFRIGWVYSRHHANFLTTIRRLAAERDVLTIVDDQVGVPTWAGSVAKAVARIVPAMASGLRSADDRSHACGVYHMSGTGVASWADLALEILRRFPVPGREHVSVSRITTADFPRPAMRPAYSVMASDMLWNTFRIALPDWRDQLGLCLERPD
jgi:dTDP-4-dehydrorhamnose reductase